MVWQKLIGSVVVLSCAWMASAQSPAPKPKPAPAPSQSKKPAAAKPPAPKAAVLKAIEPAAPPPPATDVQLRTKYVTGAQVSENATYIRGPRQRFEFPGITMITQCDLKRSVQLNDATKQYMVVPIEPPAEPAAAPAPSTPESELAAQMAAMSAGGRGAAPPKPKGGVITETVTLTDTGERKQLFGFEARHIKTVMTRQPGPNACETTATTLETDGWYADLPEHVTCSMAPTPAPRPAETTTACTDRVVAQQSGDAKLGFALSTVVTTTVTEAKDNDKDKEKDKDVTTMSMEVTELKVTSLDKALFELPAGYAEVKDYKALLPSVAKGGTLGDAVFGSIVDGTSAVAPKKDGVIRVGVVSPGNKSGKEMPDVRLVGSLLSSFTTQPFEALPVSGATAAEIDRDAAAKACDYVLVSEIAEVKTSKPNKVGGLLKKVSGDGNAPTEIHDVRVDYKLFAVGDFTKPRVSSSAKASSGGGFGLGSALRLAYFAGSLYLQTMGMGGGMMGMMGQGSPFGGMGGGLMSGRMNPGMGAAMSITSAGSSMGMPGGMAADSSDKILETVQDGLAKAGKQAADEMKKSKAAPAPKK